MSVELMVHCSAEEMVPKKVGLKVASLVAQLVESMAASLAGLTAAWKVVMLARKSVADLAV